MNYATIDDITALFRPLTPEETQRAEALLPVVCASLRTEAARVGKDLDAMAANDADLAEVAKSVTVDVVARTLMTATDQEPMTQMTESAGGYSASGIPGPWRRAVHQKVRAGPAGAAPAESGGDRTVWQAFCTGSL